MASIDLGSKPSKPAEPLSTPDKPWYPTLTISDQAAEDFISEFGEPKVGESITWNGTMTMKAVSSSKDQSGRRITFELQSMEGECEGAEEEEDMKGAKGEMGMMEEGGKSPRNLEE